jgi:hypothetical protein
MGQVTPANGGTTIGASKTVKLNQQLQFHLVIQGL